MKLKSSKGYVFIGLIGLITLLFTISFMVSWLVWFGYSKQQVETLCHRHLLRAQKHLIEAGDKIIKLNSRARSLIRQKKYWKKVLRSGHPKAKALAAAALAKISMAQIALRVQQKSLFSIGRTRSIQEIHLLRQKLFPLLKKMSQQWGRRSSYPEFSASTLGPQLQVAQRALAPTYKRKIRYDRRQELAFHWSIKLNSSRAPWKTKDTDGQWRGACHSHPRKKETQWTSHLGRAKPWSKSLSTLFSY